MFHTNYFFKTVMNVLDKMLEYIFIFQKVLMVKDQKLGLWCLTPLSTIFQLIVVVSFIDGGNWRKP